MKGSIRRRSKNSWEIRFDLPRGPKGERRRGHATIRGAKMDAQRRLRELLTMAETGLPPDTSKMTLGAYLEQWFGYHESRVRARTIYGYRNSLRRYVIPTLGHIRLTQIQPAQVDKLYISMTSNGLSPRTALQTHRILKRALKQALRWNLIVRNPLDLIDAPSFEPKEMLTLTAKQLNALVIEALHRPYGTAIIVGAYTGLRRGELTGLKWTDIDFTNGMVSVAREIVFVPGKGYIVSAPKSAKGRRVVDITPEVVTHLKRHAAQQAEHRLSIESVWKDEGWVLARPDGSHVNPNAITKAFKNLRDELELPPVRLHDLRHTHASLLLKAGVHLKVVSERLGHSNIGITADIYSHVTPGMGKDAAQKFQDMLSESEAEEATS